MRKGVEFFLDPFWKGPKPKVGMVAAGVPDGREGDRLEPVMRAIFPVISSMMDSFSNRGDTLRQRLPALDQVQQVPVGVVEKHQPVASHHVTKGISERWVVGN